MFKYKLLTGSFFIINSILTLAIFNDVPIVSQFDIVSVETILQKYKNEITYTEFMPAQEVFYDPLPFAIEEFQVKHPNHVTFDTSWVLTIPNGRVCSVNGRVLIDKKYMIRNLEWPYLKFSWYLNVLNEESPKFMNARKVSGRVAVVTCNGYWNYAHCLTDLLGRLAMLDSMAIDYDWIYIPYDCGPKFMNQILHAWGIDPSKIIEPIGEFTCIEADELIVSSFTSNLKPTPYCASLSLMELFSVRCPVWLAEYYKNKFLPLVSQIFSNHDRFSKRVFISRKDSKWRPLHNEDDVFNLFEPYGFKRYQMSDLTFLEQVELFSNADILIGAHGAALVNILFCKPGTKIFEIFQQRADCSYMFLSQSLGLDYTPIKTVDFNANDPCGGAGTFASLHHFDGIIQSLNL